MIDIVVTGSRYWTDVTAVWAQLDELAAQHTVVRVHHGGQGVNWQDPGATLRDPIGADAIAHAWCVRRGQPFTVWPANWAEYGSIAGPRRNTAMVEEPGHHLVLAFVLPCPDQRCVRGPHPHWSHGTSDCAGEAERVGLHVSVWPPGALSMARPERSRGRRPR